MTSINNKSSFTNLFLWAAFILYLIIAAMGMYHHEPWGDEIHSWNIAKASNSFSEMISNTRYEGHPPVWYSILWVISVFSHNLVWMQVVHYMIAASVVFLILFRSSFPMAIKMMIPFGYFFLFEYTVLSRNYAIALLFAFLICIIIQKQKWAAAGLISYYIVLFLLSNTHLLAWVLAAGIHFYFLLNIREQKIKPGKLLAHFLLGVIILLPAVYFIFPPGDSSLNTGYWLDRWESRHIAVMVQSPVKAFLPIPAWWEYHSWNTHFMISAVSAFPLLKWIIPLLSVSLLLFIFFALKECNKTRLFFLFFIIGVFAAAMIIPFSNARQTGFIFTGFLVASWLYCKEYPLSSIKRNIITALLVFHIAGAAIAIIKDIRHPFSNGYLVHEMLQKVPGNQKPVTDYWCLNTISAFTGTAYFCIDLKREASFIQWDGEMKKMMQKENRYSGGIKQFMASYAIQNVYMITIHPPEKIRQLDPMLEKIFNVDLIDKKEGAIEKNSNLYLYEIKTR